VIVVDERPIRFLQHATLALAELVLTWGVIVFAVMAANCSAGEFSLNRNIYRFDAGPADSVLARRSVELHPDTIYSPERGYGWTLSPQEGFHRQELSRSRNSMTIDGVSAQHVKFRVDLAPAVWHLTLWVGAGIEDESSLEVTIQGRIQPLGWQVFRAPSEQRQSVQRTFRVFQGTANVGAEGLSLELKGRHASVRLLGISLIRHADPSTTEHQQVMEQIVSAGRYGSTDSLKELSKLAEGLSAQDPSDAFYAHWQERLARLAEAERYFKMRGWEWASKETGLGLFDRLRQAVMLLDGLLGDEIEKDNPLYGRASFLRGRILYWLGKQAGGVNEVARGHRDLRNLSFKHPSDDLLAMYTGTKIDLPDECDCLDSAEGAPAWSVAQLEALCRLRLIAHWWVEEQQAENGEFGGKLGDDVELLRWWMPLVMSGDKTSQRGWEKLANGVWESRHIHDGYAKIVADVEHASEFIADTASLMAILSDDPRFVDRLMHSARHFDNVWTGNTTLGHRFFRSAWFSSTAVEAEKPKGRDLEYNSRAVKAIRYMTLRRPDPRVIQLLHEWSSAWVGAALRTDKGKPKGIIPASIRFSDESINGDEPTWYQANMFWNYFDWEHYAGSMMLDQLLFTYVLTKDERLLEPMFLSLELIRSEMQDFPSRESRSLEEGSRAWTARKLIDSELFWTVVEQWRYLTGDSRWDDLILRYGTDYGRFRITGDEGHLVKALNRILEGVRYNTPMKTTEAIHTDRVYAPGSDQLKAMLTGDGVQEGLSPYFSVTWENTNDDFTALVTETGQNQLKVQLFSHSAEVQEIVMRLWQMAPGDYRLQLDSDQDMLDKTITIKERGDRVAITLPSQQLLKVSVVPMR